MSYDMFDKIDRDDTLLLKYWQKTCVFLTRRCNLRCRGCNVINFQSSYEMTTEQWKKAFDIMKEFKVGFIVLFGGEPTLRDDLPEIVEYLNEINMPHTIITNGIRLLKDEKFYKRLLDSKPFGISASVNHIDSMSDAKFGDQKKSNFGQDLLLQLKKDVPDMDLVANMAVTRENIRSLPDMVSYFTSFGIWSILSFFHVCPQRESMYWWYRGPVNEDNQNLVFRMGDRWMISRIAQWFIDHYEGLKLHNQKDYFKVWPQFGITQDWHCSEWACPAVNPDGSLMACIDRPLSKPFSIFDLPLYPGKIYQNFKEVISVCPGCFTGNTQISTKVGKKKISSVKVGAKVPSYDVENQCFGESIVIKKSKRYAVPEDIMIITVEKGTDVRKFYATMEHPFYVVDKGWIDSEDLKAGDILFTITKSEQMSYVKKDVSSMTPDGRRKISNRMKNDNPMFNPVHHQKMVNATRSPEVREKSRQAGFKSWKDPNKYKNRAKTLHKSPNRSEKKLIKLFEKNDIPFKYNKKVRVDGKTPDFLLPSEKKIVELFGVHWHKPEEEAVLIERYKKVGHKCLIIWDYELEHPEDIVSKVKRFIYNGIKVLKVQNLSEKLNCPLPEEVRPNKFGKIAVYNVECTPNHNYLLGRILVHNCFWDHMYETNKYASENRSELGKNRFSHQSNKDT